MVLYCDYFKELNCYPLLIFTPVKNPKHKAQTPSGRTGHAQWIELSIEVHPVAQEAVSAFLFELGCEGVALGERENGVLKAYLPVSEFSEKIRKRTQAFLRNLREFFPEAGHPSLLFSTIQGEDWNVTWRRHFHVEQVTERLTVVPTWEPIPMHIKTMVIRMDPGPAFGTGSHPTTRMCLKGIESFDAPHGWTVLDVGTGSGILAIYAAKLGAERVFAVDTDPEALRWAQRNVELNRPLGFIELSSKPLAELNGRFSLLVANLTHDTLLELLPDFQRLLEGGGGVILSGLLQDQAQDVERPLGRLGFQDVHISTQAEWACVTARKKG